jgi:hypothetical protein
MGNRKYLYPDCTVLDYLNYLTVSGLFLTLLTQVLQKDKFDALLLVRSLGYHLSTGLFHTLCQFLNPKHVLLLSDFRLSVTNTSLSSDLFLQLGTLFQNSSRVLSA